MSKAVLSLSAGTVLPASVITTVDIAADAGYEWVGLRPDPAMTSAEADAVRARLSARAMRVFDIEVVRLGVTPAKDAARLAELAVALGASWLLVTSHLGDAGDTERALAALVDRCDRLGGTARPAFEFMAFTEVRTILDAMPIVRATGAGLVIDALHVYRNGHDPTIVHEALANDPPPLYLQLCDTDQASLPDDELAEEARHRRLVPGAGLLPLREMVAAVPSGTAVCVEVQSDGLLGDLGPVEHARRCRMAAEAILGP